MKWKSGLHALEALMQFIEDRRKALIPAELERSNVSSSSGLAGGIHARNEDVRRAKGYRRTTNEI